MSFTASGLRHPLLLLALMVLPLHAGCVLACQSNATDRPPNVILINADDRGYGDLSCYGAKLVNTPNIDALAERGRRFTDAHSPHAVCSPSRYGLLTGTYPLRRNMWGPLPRTQPLTIGLDQLTLGKLFKQVGYDTACIGKWHLGFGKGKTDWNKPLKPGPNDVGFDYYFGLPIVNSGPPYVYVENDAVVGYDPEDPFVFGKGVTSATQQFPAKGGTTVSAVPSGPTSSTAIKRSAPPSP